MIDYEKMTKDLFLSPDFLSALDSLYQRIEKEPDMSLVTMALSMFVMGYASCIEFNKKKEESNPYKFKSYKDMVNSDNKECQHESDGSIYCSNPPQNKCIKCGGFYR